MTDRQTDNIDRQTETDTNCCPKMASSNTIPEIGQTALPSPEYVNNSANGIVPKKITPSAVPHKARLFRQKQMKQYTRLTSIAYR